MITRHAIQINMETKYKVGDKVACAVCCRGRHTTCPPNLLGEVVIVLPADPNLPSSFTRYMTRLPNGMMDLLHDGTARPEAPDPNMTGKMRHALEPG
jgi:hypothetical protein